MLPLLALAPWLLLVALALAGFRRRPRLREFAARSGGPRVSIIVPARNEAGNIGICLATLAHSQYEDREIIVVDDESVDGTGDIVRALMRRSDGDIRLVEGEPLPDGWFGKPWACWQGFEHATGDVLLFTDADTRHEGDLLGRCVAALEERRADLVTVLGEQELLTFWERLIMPHILFMLAVRYRAPAMNRARKPLDVVANGQFILIRREAYEAIDGHRGVRGEVVEDLRLAQRTIAAGRRLFAAHAEEFMQTRMYRSLGDIVEGWSKNLAIGSRAAVPDWLSPVVPWSLALFLLVAWVAPLTIVGLAAAGVFAFGDVGWWAFAAVMLGLVFWTLLNLRLKVPSLYTLLFPVGALAAAGIVVRSAVRGQRVEWRGRKYG